MKIFLLVIFWSFWFLNFCVRMSFSPLLPIIEEELAITHAVAGGLFSFMAVGGTISVFMSGWVAKHIGYKRSILFGYIALALVSLCLKYAHTYYFFAGCSFLIGFMAGIYFPCVVPLLTSIVSRVNWGKAIAFHETAPSFSFLAVPILVALTIRLYPWQSFFVMLSGACVLCVVLFWIFAPDPRPQKEKKSSYATVLRRPDFWIISILWIMAAMATVGIYTIIPLFLVTEKGMQVETANTIFGISRIGGVFATMLVGFLVDRFAIKKILFTILFITGLATMGMALAQVLWLLVGMLVIQGTMGVVFFPAVVTAISSITSPEERTPFIGMAMAISSLFSFGFVPAGLGAVADQWNFQIGILAMGIVIILSCALIRQLKELR
jgi:NNP family nitrate/nitrite transporter-like MFS transporter